MKYKEQHWAVQQLNANEQTTRTEMSEYAGIEDQPTNQQSAKRNEWHSACKQTSLPEQLTDKNTLKPD